MQVFVETGTLDFESSNPARSDRIDDLNAFGGTLAFDLSDSVTAHVDFSEVEYTSNIPGIDRSITRIGAGLAIGRGLVPW
jgi:hypothetical protein